MAFGSLVFVVLAAFFWGISGGIGGLLISHDWDPFVVSFYRGAVGLALVVGWLAIHHHHSGLHHTRFWLWSIIAGIGVAGNFSFYLISVAEGGVAIASTLMYCAPVLVYVVSLLLGLERLSAVKLTAIALVLTGIVLLTELHDVSGSSVTLMGAAAGLGAGLAYTGFIFGFKFAVPNGSPQASLSIAFTVVALVLIWPADKGEILTVPAAPDRVMFAALGVLGGGFSFLIYVIGLKNTAPVVASLIAMIEPVTALLFAFAVLGERLAVSQLVGMALILVAVTAMSVHATPARHHLGYGS